MINGNELRQKLQGSYDSDYIIALSLISIAESLEKLSLSQANFIPPSEVSKESNR